MAKRDDIRNRRRKAQIITRCWEQKKYFDRAPMPRLLVDPEFGSAELVSTIQTIASQFDAQRLECRGEVPAKYFVLLREFGFDGFQDFMRQCVSLQPDPQRSSDDVVFHQIMGAMSAPGNWLFERLPADLKQGSLMSNFFYVVFDGDDFVVKFRELETASSAGGKVYIPPGKPSVRLADRQWAVALHKHAMERICERLIATPRPTYTQYLFVWACLSGNVWKYEPITLNDGQQALRVLTHISADDAGNKWHDVYVKQIIGEDNLPQRGQRLAVVLGYLPVEVSGRFARAVTFLFPGYSNTPEAKLVDALPPDAWMRRRVRALAKDANFHSLFYRKAAEAIRWYHENGVPQVFPV
jgi:hypothetical protein